MKTKTIELTLSKAKEWYSGDIQALKEIALQAFSEEELTSIEYTDITTFTQACNSIGLNPSVFQDNVSRIKNLGVDSHTKKHLISTLKIDIIRRALNGKDWEPSLTSGNIHVPTIEFCFAGDKSEKFAKNQRSSVGSTFKVNGEKYSLITGKSELPFDSCGLGGFVPGCCGDAYSDTGLFGCKSPEIAKHMSRYFDKEIFDACYSHLVDYEWC